MDFDLSKIVDMVVGYAPKVAGAIIALVVGFWLANFISKKVKTLLEKRNIDPTLVPFLTSLVAILIKILVLLSAAGMFGIEVTSFVAIFSALAFAVGMALQGNLSHMAAGIMMLIFKPFKVADFIVTNGYSGTVKEIQLFNTILVTLDNRIIIIPNGTITAAPLENLTMNPKRKVPMTFGIGYTDDIDKARKIIQSVADACPEVDHTQEVDIIIVELADSSVNFAVRPWCKTEDYWTVFAFMHEEIKKAFDKEGIGIPFPQMDVHVKND